MGPGVEPPDRRPFVTLRQNGGAHSDFVDFSFGGENKKAFGEGEATLEGERLTFELWHYHGDEYTFICERRR